MSRLTGSQMKYLYIIYKMQDSENDLRSVDIARRLGVSKASVSRMVKLLAGMKYIVKSKAGVILLTPKGKKEGALIHDRVTGIYPFFSDYLGLDGAEALDSTYSFLCGFSDNCVRRLAGKEWARGKAPA